MAAATTGNNNDNSNGNSNGNNNTSSEQKPQKSQRQILQHTEEAALTQIKRSTKGLLLSGFSAGLDIGFSVFLMLIAFASFSGVFAPAVVHFIVSNMYPIGFIFVILGRSELFTEHTTLAILPVLQRLATIKQLLRLWLIVYASNLFGGLLFALILTYFGHSLHIINIAAIEHLSNVSTEHNWATNLLSAALAGWMMGLLAWLVAASRETISQILIIWIVTASIGFAGLPHVIVGNIEVLTGVFNGNIPFSRYLHFLSSVTLGNAIGGVFFVGILKFSHTAFSGEEEEIDLDNN